MLEPLEVYISAQKTVAGYFMGLGVFLLVMAVFFHLAGSNPLLHGLRTGLFVVGLLGLANGYGYRVAEVQLLKKQTERFQQSPAQFHQVETERMAKVVKTFPYYQIGFIVVITGALIAIFFLETRFVQGILFAVIMFLLGNMIIEKLSQTSIDHYFGQLANL